MTIDIRPTVLDVSRAVARLDEHSDDSSLAQLVASNLAYQFARHNGWGGRKNVTMRDVRAALITHGASTLTVELWSRRIAHTIRNDFSDGMR